MGNRESAPFSDNSADFLESSTASTSVSGFAASPSLTMKRPPPPPKSSPTPAPPSLRLSRCSNSSSSSSACSSQLLPILTMEPPTPDSPVSLCSVLNHHHDGALGCVCRRSLSSEQQQQPPPPRPRILPIVRNGRQLSDDLFWVLPPRRKQQQQQQQQQDRGPSGARPFSSCSSEQSCCEPVSFYGPGCTPLDLVHRVTAGVFGVTDEESYLALSLHHWDVDKASRYLKVEQLFRSGVFDRDKCRRLLELHSWQLESVVRQLSRKRCCRSASK